MAEDSVPTLRLADVDDVTCVVVGSKFEHRIESLRAREKDLNAYSKLLEETVDNMDQGLLAFDAKDVVRVYNRRVLELMNVPRELLDANPTFLELREYQRGAGEFGSDEEFCRSLAETGLRVNHLPYEHERPDGTIVEVRTVRLSDGGAVRTYTDITERKTRERALRDREEEVRIQSERLKAALENMKEGLCMFDVRRRLIVCNTAFAKIYALPPHLVEPGTAFEQILEHRANASTGPRDLECFVHGHARLVADESPNQYRVQLQDGRTVRVSHEPMPASGWVETHDDISDAIEAEARIAYLARHDSLTDLPNRVLFRDSIEHSLRQIPERGLVAVLYLDLDHFKSVNDTLGHPVGDALLRAVAERLRHCTRDSDVIARLGGDEFAIVQAELTRSNDAAALAQRVIDAVSANYDLDGHNVVIGTSVGIAMAPTDATNPDQLLKAADLALYRAKSEGRGTYRFFEPDMDVQMQDRRKFELSLRAALAKDEFELYYQPIADAKSGEIGCCEALLRWNHPNRGIVLPGDFIPLAEEIGLMGPIGEWVLRQACREATRWPDRVRVAVNLSPVQFKNRNLALTVISALGESGLSAHRLELEITEATLLHDNEATLAILHQFRALGVRIAMDDFGTGYSSLSYLRSFPFDKIKIDQTFIRGLSDNRDCIAIVRAITGLGASLAMSTTAEGVETQQEFDLSCAEGCTEIQGYFLSPARPADQIARFLKPDGACQRLPLVIANVGGRP